jgi:hypothetical protein
MVAMARRRENICENRGVVARGKQQTKANISRPSPFITIFLLSIALPINFYIGPIRLSPYRLVIILLFLPGLIVLLSGKLGRVRATDKCMLLFAVWGAIALFATTPFDSAVQSAGIFIIESLGAYLLGRSLVRNEISFQALLRALFIMLLIMLPLALYETITDHSLVLDTIRPFFDVISKGNQEPRFGLYRAQVVFEHPILYGAFASSLLGLVYYAKIVHRKPVGGIGWSAVVSFASALSLSSGALAALSVQCVLIAWDRNTRSISYRWTILGALVLALYLIIDLLSNRTPFHVLVTYLTFSTGSSYNRILIWIYGTAEVWRHPLFGIGFADWVRPPWMGPSMDNFWLVIAVRYGLPAFVLLAAAFAFLFHDIGRIKYGSENLIKYRAGLFVSLGGLIIAGCTVDYWNAIYCWFLFLLGSGMWMLRGDSSDEGLHISASRNRPRAKDNGII